MSKAICIYSTTSVNNTNIEVEKTISNFLGEQYSTKDTRMDVFILKPVDGKINSDMLNQYIEFLKTTALNGEKKVGLIIDFDLLSIQNQNKLLIFIEQENDKLLQIYTTNNLRNIITTIQSRLNIHTLEDQYFQELNSEQKKDALYTKIITSSLELEVYKTNQEFLDSMYEKIVQKQYSSAFILYTIKLQKYDAILFTLIYRMLLSTLTNNYALAQKVIKLEKQLNSNSNKKLQMDNIFVTIMEGTTWN